jgi:hypothetical protein
MERFREKVLLLMLPPQGILAQQLVYRSKGHQIGNLIINQWDPRGTHIRGFKQIRTSWIIG